jgi:ABC-type multidrug transport system ATPase subunit
MTNLAIEIKDIKKSFGKTSVLKNLSLNVPYGQTFAFLGRNGEGKTTTIKTLLGLLPPDSGEIKIMGLNPKTDAIEIRRQVGYLAEDQEMFGWMRVHEIIKFLKPFYPTWDDALTLQLLKRFDLDKTKKIKHLSKGQSVRLGLLLAMAHNPKLVILDDPTLGLDPIMRKEFLRDVVEHLQGNGVTIFFSSHLLYEVEPIADTIAILDGGSIIKLSATETLRNDVKQIIISNDDYEKLKPIPNLIDVKHSSHQTAIITEKADETLTLLQSQNITNTVVNLNLDEIFEAYVTGRI